MRRETDQLHITVRCGLDDDGNIVLEVDGTRGSFIRGSLQDIVNVVDVASFVEIMVRTQASIMQENVCKAIGRERDIDDP